MRILLIHPQHQIQRFGTGVYKKHLRYAPLTMPTLAALVPKELNAKVQVIDEMVEEIDFNIEADLVGVTGITSAAPRSYEIARRFRQRGIKTVMGGVHATMMPNEALQHVDSVVRGYAEASWPQLLRDFRAGTMKRLYEGAYSPSRDLIIAPDRSHIKRSKYIACNA